ncbi:NACHT domain-containing protein [Streptomyces sp. NPDC091201]|uniref:NACHT domain-containing protein n=1 Tax=Streptomyces sp. NPDC091201 TaxID=3155190 RepID=UPI00343B8484
MTDGIIRTALLAGTAQYQFQDPLDAVPDDIDSVEKALSRLGYLVSVLPTDLTTQGFRNELMEWTGQTDRTDHALVIYYTGHGDFDHNRHYLLFTDSRTGQLTGTALATDDLIGITADNGVRRLLLIIDTCFAGQGGADLVREHVERIQAKINGSRQADPVDISELSVIVAARACEPANDGAFARAFAAAIDDLLLAGNRQTRLYLPELVGRINTLLGGSQHAVYGTPYGEGIAFFPNPRYIPELPAQDEPGMDLAEQRTWLSPEGRRRRAELMAHFGPRGRGVDAGGQGSYFTGRAVALARLVDWLNATGTAPPAHLVVTGGPGVGKSSLLGRLVLLADDEQRATLPDVATDVPLPRRGADVTIHARSLRLEEVVSGIADAVGLETADPADLLSALQDRSDPLFVVIDALDEAGPVGGTEPTRIATALLRPMTDLASVRLLVGTRRHVVAALGPSFDQLDLDDPQWTGAEDIEGYARKLLLAPDGPASHGPYQDDGSALTAVAREIARRAGGVYLVARLLARALAQQDRSLDVTVPDWQGQLPSTGSTGTAAAVFGWSLGKRLGTRESDGRALLAALAFTEGAGLLPGSAWLTIARTLTEGALAEEDLRWILREAAPYLVEQLDSRGRSVYRLYHEAYAEELRSAFPPDTGREVSRCLLGSVPVDAATGARDWSAADPYVLAHVATHLAEHDLLHEVVTDAGFLLNVDSTTLSRALSTALPQIRNDANLHEAAAAGDAWLRCTPYLRWEPDFAARAAQLSLAAAQTGAGQLLASVRERFPDLPFGLVWEHLQDAAPYRALGWFDGRVDSAAAFRLDGRPVIATLESPHRIRLWDLGTGEELDGLPTHDQDSRPVVDMTAVDDGEHAYLLVRTPSVASVWDIRVGHPVGPAHPVRRDAKACLVLVDGRPLSIFLEDGMVHVVDSGSGLPLVKVSLDLQGALTPHAVACGMHAGRLVVAAATSWSRTEPGLPTILPSPDNGRTEPTYIPTLQTVHGRTLTRHTIDPAGWSTVGVQESAYQGERVEHLMVHEGKVRLTTSDPRGSVNRAEWLTEISVPAGDGVGSGLRKGTAGVLVNDGIPLVVGSVDGGIVITRGDAEAGRVVAHVETGDRAQPILPVALGNGELMVITTTAAGGGTLKAWTVTVNAEQETVVPLLAHSAKTGSDMTLGRVGNRPMLLARRGPEWIAVEPDSGQPITPWPFQAPIEGFVPSADQGFPAVACLAEEDRNARKVRFALPQAPGANLGSISITAKAGLAVARTREHEQLLVAYTGNRLVLWDLSSGKILERKWMLTLPRAGRAPTLSTARVGDRTFTALCHRPKSPVHVHELPSLAPVAVVTPTSTVVQNSRGELVMAIGDWDGQLVVAWAGIDGSVVVHDVATHVQLGQWKVPDHNHAVRLLPLMSHGKPAVLALCSDESLALLSDAEGPSPSRIRIGVPVSAWALASPDLIALQTPSGPLCLRLPGEVSSQ